NDKPSLSLTAARKKYKTIASWDSRGACSRRKRRSIHDQPSRGGRRTRSVTRICLGIMAVRLPRIPEVYWRTAHGPRIYDRGRPLRTRERRRCNCQAVAKGVSATTFLACRLILELAFDAAHKTLAQQPFTFTVSGPIHGRAALVATVRSGRAGGFPHRLVTAGPIAKNFGMPSICVTTRGPGGGRHALALRGRLGRMRLPLASLAFRVGAVVLVLPPGAEPPAAVFAEARSPPQPPPGGDTLSLGMLNPSHGR